MNFQTSFVGLTPCGTLTPRSFTRLFWVMMPFEVEYWYSSATRGSSVRKWPGRGALWQRSSNFCSWRSMLLEVDHSMTWLRSAWVLIASLTESTRPAILVSSAKVLKKECRAQSDILSM